MPKRRPLASWRWNFLQGRCFFRSFFPLCLSFDPFFSRPLQGEALAAQYGLRVPLRTVGDFDRAMNAADGAPLPAELLAQICGVLMEGVEVTDSASPARKRSKH